MFKLKSKKTVGDKVQGIFSKPIKYEVRVPSGDWSSYFGKYQNQRWGQWDSNSCWCLSAINCAEDQLEWLMKNNMFSPEAISFFKTEGYLDEDGDFSCSERYIEILSGVHDDGNNQMEVWRLMQIHGLIPRKDLTYTQEKAKSFLTKTSFNSDYFNPGAITQEMELKGQKFLSYVNIARQWIGTAWKTPETSILKAALKQAPLQIGFPVPKNLGLYNSPIVIPYDGGVNADHATELYNITENGIYEFFDQYNPNLKSLSANYFIPFVTQGILTAVQPQAENSIPQDSYWDKFWTAVNNWYNNIPNSFPVGHVHNSSSQ